LEGENVMKNVIEQISKEEKKQKIHFIELVIDDELVTLYHAIKQNDLDEILQTKERLSSLVSRLKALKM